MAHDDQWGSIQSDEWVEPRIIPNPDQPPWENLYDWSLENPSTNEDVNN